MSDKIRHNKVKNTGILFELLTIQLANDIMSGKSNSPAQKLIESYFKHNSDLGKEFVLYQALLKYKYDDLNKAKLYLTEILKSHKQLNSISLKKSKYNLVKEIKEKFNEDEFFKPKLENYKILASIYKMFKSNHNTFAVTPSDVVNAKITIIEHIMQTHEKDISTDQDDLINEYKKQTSDLRLLTYKLMIDRFNEKYSGLDISQKNLIREYINNISHEFTLKKYVNDQIPLISNELIDLNGKITNKVTKIKINEVLNQLDSLKNCDLIKDDHVFALLNIYELIKELYITIDGEN